MSSEVEEHIGAAALLHDVTHAPFGHTLEDERRLFPRHDKGARLQQLLAGDLGALLQRLGCLDSVKGILGAGQESSPRWMQLIISGTVDADMLDYLRRDSYHAGLAQAYDDRVFNYFLVEDDQLALQMTKHGMEQPDARSEIVQLLRMRYFLTERIYYHHTKVVAGAMVSKAVEIAQEHGALREAEVQQLTDATLFQHLASVPRAKNPDPRLKRLVAALEQRRLLKRGYVLSPLTVPMEERARLVERFHLDGAARR